MKKLKEYKPEESAETVGFEEVINRIEKSGTNGIIVIKILSMLYIIMARAEGGEGIRLFNLKDRYYFTSSLEGFQNDWESGSLEGFIFDDYREFGEWLSKQ